MAAKKVSLKLLIDNTSPRVLFAEADKKFVDFLFSIFTLPVGTVTRLLQKQSMAGCLGSLYKSIENLSDIYIQPDQDKNFLLNPKAAISGAKVPLLLPSIENLSDIYIQPYQDKKYLLNPKVANVSGAKLPLLLPSVEHSYTDTKFYRCGGYNNCKYIANDQRAICPSCRSSMTTKLTHVDPPSDINAFEKVVISRAKVPILMPSVERSYTGGKVCKKSCKRKGGSRSCTRSTISSEVPIAMNSEVISYVEYHPPRDIKASSSGEGGYVKGLITYIVIDDLDMKPMSTISAITLLIKLNITDVGAVEEKVVDFGMDEGERLLGASLQSKTALTDVFLPNNGNHTVNEEYKIQDVE